MYDEQGYAGDAYLALQTFDTAAVSIPCAVVDTFQCARASIVS